MGRPCNACELPFLIVDPHPETSARQILEAPHLLHWPSTPPLSSAARSPISVTRRSYLRVPAAACVQRAYVEARTRTAPQDTATSAPGGDCEEHYIIQDQCSGSHQMQPAWLMIHQCLAGFAGWRSGCAAAAGQSACSGEPAALRLNAAASAQIGARRSPRSCLRGELTRGHRVSCKCRRSAKGAILVRFPCPPSSPPRSRAAFRRWPAHRSVSSIGKRRK